MQNSKLLIYISLKQFLVFSRNIYTNPHVDIPVKGNQIDDTVPSITCRQHQSHVINTWDWCSTNSSISGTATHTVQHLLTQQLVLLDLRRHYTSELWSNTLFSEHYTSELWSNTLFSELHIIDWRHKTCGTKSKSLCWYYNTSLSTCTVY